VHGVESTRALKGVNLSIEEKEVTLCCR